MASNVSSLYIEGQEVASIFIDGNLWYQKTDATVLDVGLVLDTTQVYLLPSDGLSSNSIFIYPTTNQGVTGIYTLTAPDFAPINLSVTDDGGFFRIEYGYGAISPGTYKYTIKFTPHDSNDKEVINDTAIFTINVDTSGLHFNNHSVGILYGPTREFTTQLLVSINDTNFPTYGYFTSNDGNYCKVSPTTSYDGIFTVSIEDSGLNDSSFESDITDNVLISAYTRDGTWVCDQPIPITIADPF